MQNDKLKVILDPNLWISFLISKTLSKLDAPILQGKIKLIFSNESLTEFLEVAAFQKFKDYFSYNDIVELFEYMNLYGTVFSVQSKVHICRDKKDNFWLELAKDSNADYLISGDKDLLVLKNYGNTKILNFKNFITEIT